jgi:hypothetical protein
MTTTWARYRASVIEATGEEAVVARAPVIAICASTFWRNAWRYRERAYRESVTTLRAVLREPSSPPSPPAGAPTPPRMSVPAA